MLHHNLYDPYLFGKSTNACLPEKHKYGAHYLSVLPRINDNNSCNQGASRSDAARSKAETCPPSFKRLSFPFEKRLGPTSVYRKRSI